MASSVRMSSEIFGKGEKEMHNRSRSQNHYGTRLSRKQSVSVNRQEKQEKGVLKKAKVQCEVSMEHIPYLPHYSLLKEF